MQLDNMLRSCNTIRTLQLEHEVICSYNTRVLATRKGLSSTQHTNQGSTWNSFTLFLWKVNDPLIVNTNYDWIDGFGLATEGQQTTT